MQDDGSSTDWKLREMPISYVVGGAVAQTEANVWQVRILQTGADATLTWGYPAGCTYGQLPGATARDVTHVSEGDTDRGCIAFTCEHQEGQEHGVGVVEWHVGLSSRIEGLNGVRVRVS